MKIFIIIERGMITDIYADTNKIEVEVIDLDEQDENELSTRKRADEIQAEFVRVD